MISAVYLCILYDGFVFRDPDIVLFYIKRTGNSTGLFKAWGIESTYFVYALRKEVSRRAGLRSGRKRRACRDRKRGVCLQRHAAAITVTIPKTMISPFAGADFDMASVTDARSGPVRLPVRHDGRRFISVRLSGSFSHIPCNECIPCR